MKTLTIEVKDEFFPEFMQMIEAVKDNVIVKKDKNLELDPYFYERQKELKQILENKGNGISHDKLWTKVHKHLETIKPK
jgi:hypothetical protein